MMYELRKIGPSIACVCGAGSWLMLLAPPIWWIGVSCTLAALVLSWRVLRRRPTHRAVRLQAGIGLCSAAVAAAVCIAFLKTAPVLPY